MLQTRQKVFRIVPKCPKMSQNVPKCPLQTHRCPNGLVFQFLRRDDFDFQAFIFPFLLPMMMMIMMMMMMNKNDEQCWTKMIKEVWTKRTKTRWPQILPESLLWEIEEKYDRYVKSISYKMSVRPKMAVFIKEMKWFPPRTPKVCRTWLTWPKILPKSLLWEIWASCEIYSL